MEDWLRAIGLGDRIASFRQNRITEDQLAELTEADLRELGLTIGERKLFQRALQPQAAAKPAIPAPRRGERRTLTVMFVDLVESTSLGERLDPEDMLEVIRLYRAFASEAIARFDGFVARVIGDGILAYFGYPAAHENDPERAARAALAIVGGIGGLITPAGSPLCARVGLATGRAVVSDILSTGFHESSGVTGAVVNLAARLQSLGAANAIVVSESTYPRLSTLFTCDPLGEVTLRGIDRPHRPWRLTGERQNLFLAWPAERPPRLTALHGRAPELGVLQSAWNRARNGDGRAVLVRGGSGIGKSRLVEHLLNQHLSDPGSVIHLSALALDEDSPLRPVVDHLRGVAGLAPDDDRSSSLAKLSAILAGDEEDRRRALPVLGALAGVPGEPGASELPPEELRAVTVAVLIDQFLARARERPLCLVVEDLHWIDPTSRELLDRLIECIGEVPMLLLMTARENFRPAWEAHRNVAVLPLAPLAPEHVMGMINDLFGARRPVGVIARQIAERTDGVPLFVEEVGRVLLARLDDLLTDVLEPAMPDSLQESLMARLDRCGPAKAVAQVAAVAGRSVRRDLLAWVCDTAPSSLAEPLATLVGAGILERQVALGQDSYVFSHALVRDTAYDSLLRDQRRELHARVANAMQTLDPSSVARNPEILALHLTEGGAAEAAAPHWIEAVRRSLARSALTEAARMLRRALDALEAAAPTAGVIALRIQMSALLGAALSGLKGPNSIETREHYAAALELCRESPEDPSHFPIYWGWWRLEPGSLQRAAVLLERARAGGDAGHLLQAHHSNWACHLNAGLFHRCCEHIDAGLQIYAAGDYTHHAGSYGNHDAKVCAHGIRAQAYWLQGKLRHAMQDEVQSMSWSRQLDHLGSRVHALGLTLLHRVYRRDYYEVYARAGELIELTSDHGVADHGAAGMIFRGWVRALQGDPAGGLATLEQGVARQTHTATSEDYPVYLCLLAEALIEAGKPEQAAERLLRERLTFERGDIGIWLPEYYRMTGCAVLAADPASVGQARALYAEAAALAEEQGAIMLTLRIAHSEALLEAKYDLLPVAKERLRRAVAAIPEPDGSADFVEATRLTSACLPEAEPAT